MWNPRVVDLFDFTTNQFSLLAAFQVLGMVTQGFLTNIYGPPCSKQKMNFLESLRMLKLEAGIKPWFLGGDFNLVRNLDEKKGGIQKFNHANEYLNEVIENLELVDVRMTNGTYTWNNKKPGDRGISCRLDLLLVSESIIMKGGEMKAPVLPSAGSDHWPISLKWKNVGVNPCRPF